MKYVYKYIANHWLLGRDKLEVTKLFRSWGARFGSQALYIQTQ